MESQLRGGGREREKDKGREYWERKRGRHEPSRIDKPIYTLVGFSSSHLSSSFSVSVQPLFAFSPSLGPVSSPPLSVLQHLSTPFRTPISPCVSSFSRTPLTFSKESSEWPPRFPPFSRQRGGVEFDTFMAVSSGFFLPFFFLFHSRTVFRRVSVIDRIGKLLNSLSRYNSIIQNFQMGVIKGLRWNFRGIVENKRGEE